MQVRMSVRNSKETILNQALAIFSRLGFHKTTMADIANASNRGRRTIYTYFKSKEEVFEAVVEREIDKVLILIHQKLKQSVAADEKLLIYFQTRLKSIIELTRYHEALRIAYQNNYQLVERIREKLDKEEKVILKKVIEEGIQQGQFVSDDIKIVVDNLSVMIRGIEFILINEDNEQLSDVQIQSMRDLVLNGLRTRNFK